MAKEIKHLDEQGIRLLIRLISSLQNETSNLANKCILPYDDSKTYQTSDICYKDGSLWYCKVISNGNPPVYGDNHWEVIDGYENEIDSAYIEQLMNEVTPEQWTKLQEVISEEISTNKVWSSSKSYTENQNILAEAKNYTLEEIAKSTTGSYVIANSTDDVLDDKHLYLISNASGNFDIYALVNSVATKIGDTSVNLDGLLTEQDAENTYLKITDATSTYATITTTDGLRTDLDNHTNDTVAHLTQEEKDKLLTYDDITTTINSSSTDTEIPSAKAVNTVLNNKTDKMKMLISQNVNDLVTEGSYYVITCTNAPDVYGWIDVLANNDYTVQLFYPSITANCDMYIRRRQGGGAWSSWQRMCSTKVGDVPRTTIVSEDTDITLTVNCHYEVINGICYIQLWPFQSATTGQHIISNSIPKSKLTVLNACNYGTNGEVGGYIFINDEGKLYAEVNITGQPLYGSLSYPVAES